MSVPLHANEVHPKIAQSLSKDKESIIHSIVLESRGTRPISHLIGATLHVLPLLLANIAAVELCGPW
jgi:hypothetical protein